MSWPFLAGALLLVGTAAASTPGDLPAGPPVQALPAPQPSAGPAVTPTVEAALDDAELLALAAERYQRMTVAVSIMDEGPYRFIVDTGAQATVLSYVIADQLGLDERGSALLVGVNSQRTVETAAVPRLSLGSRSFKIAQAALVDPLHIGAADGILGLDSLQHQRVLLDFREGRIAVADSASEGRTGYEIVVRARRKLGQLIIARADIDGVRTAVIVDTGAQGSIGNTALERRLRRAHSFGSSQMTDINGIQREGNVRLVGSLKIGRARLANMPITFADSPTFRLLGLDDEPALLLGMAELRLFNRVAIDFSKREVLFDLPASARRPFASPDASYPVG